jgi:hypothetical protein
LRANRAISLDALRRLAQAANLPIAKKASRIDVIDALLRPPSTRITRSVEDLATHSENEIADYLQQTECTKGELMLFLDAADIPYEGGRSRSQLIADAAREISRIGLYQRISGKRTGSSA